MYKKVLNLVIFFLAAYNALSQGGVGKIGKNFIEFEVVNQGASPKRTINPFFLGRSKLERKDIVFELYNDRYRFNNDTLFLYLNDTAISPGIEKYNLGDSIRLIQGYRKYDTLFSQGISSVKYFFPKKKYSFLVLFYSFSELTGSYRESKMLFLDVKRRKRK